MATTVPDLWPASIRVDVLSPVAILKTQAAILKDRTGGLLEAEVITSADRDGEDVQITHRFEILARSLDGYRHQLLLAHHNAGLAYPVILESDALPREAIVKTGFDNRRMAYTQEEFQKVVGQVLGSARTVAVLESLLARINDANTAPAR